MVKWKSVVTTPRDALSVYLTSRALSEVSAMQSPLVPPESPLAATRKEVARPSGKLGTGRTN